MELLQVNPNTWDQVPSYQRFRNFVKNLTIVNDPAERGVGLIKQFIDSFQSEEACQDNLIAVAAHRKISNKETLANIGLKKLS